MPALNGKKGTKYGSPLLTTTPLCQQISEHSELDIISLVGAQVLIYVKSFLAGLVALFSLSALIIGAAFFAPVVMERLPLSEGVGFVSFPVWPIIAGVLIISAAVSYFTFQKARASRDGLGSSSGPLGI